MAPDLLRLGDDLISVSADFNDELFDEEFTRVSESDDARTRATFKDKFNSCINADKSYLYDFKIIHYRSVLPIITRRNLAYLLQISLQLLSWCTTLAYAKNIGIKLQVSGRLFEAKPEAKILYQKGKKNREIK